MFTNILSTKRSHIKFAAPEEPVIGEVKPHLQPWEHIDYSPEKQQALYVGWGTHCARKSDMGMAESYFNRALNIRADDAKTLSSRSICKRSLSKTTEAFEDSLKATFLEPMKPNISLEFTNTIYELNEFEVTLGECCNISRLFVGPYQKIFQNFCCVINENISDCLGDSLGFFLNTHKKLCDKVLQDFKLKNNIDKRPLWKILKEQGHCDVVSIPEKEEILLHPLEVARRYRALKVFYQKYLPRTWVDFISLRDISNNSELFGSAFIKSTPKLQALLRTQIEAVKKFAKMLHARHPIYSDLEDRKKREHIWKRCHESHLNIIQYQTRRNMFIVLRNIRELSKTNEIEKLSKYVEKVMGDYFVLKTHRIAPWRFEFINEVYNLLALTHINMYSIPEDFEISGKYACERLLHITLPSIDLSNTDKENCFKSSKKRESSLKGPKLYLKRLEKRLFFAKWSIERMYLYYEIARNHFKINSMNESASSARKGCEEALRSSNFVYAFLCTMQVARAQASDFKIEKSLRDITKAREIAEHLDSQALLNYTDVASALVEYKIAERRGGSLRMVTKHGISFESMLRGSVYSTAPPTTRSSTSSGQFSMPPAASNSTQQSGSNSSSPPVTSPKISSYTQSSIQTTKSVKYDRSQKSK